MQSLFLSMSFLFLSVTAHAAMDAKEATRRINAAVKVFATVAMSGTQTYKIEKNLPNVKEALREVALNHNSDDEESFERDWNDEAWSADSSAFGLATFKEAFSYLTDISPDFDNAYSDLTEAQTAALNEKMKKVKAAMRTLLGSGVEFGLAPMGAVQCGVTFAALAIVDLRGGKVHLIAREGSGC